MHGRPREFKHVLKDPKTASGYQKKVEAIRQGTTLVMQCRKEKRYDTAALEAAAKLLKVVPEIYTLWNYRREALQPVFDAGGDAAKRASDAELALTMACLRDNPKSYSTWFHRKWVVLRGFCSLQQELDQVTRALQLDERNFHAWSYRKFIVKLMGRSAEAELEYAEEKIMDNFSNYSAWHCRTILLPQLYNEDIRTVSFEELLSSPPPSAAPGEGSKPDAGSAATTRPIPIHVLDQEYDQVHQAFATDSFDQSPWMYYRWLIGNSLAHLEQARDTPAEEDAGMVLSQVLEREIARLQDDPFKQDPDAKWPLLTLARLQEAQVRLKLVDEDQAGSIMQDVRQKYQRLAQVDPLRKNYYQDALDGKAFVVVQALGTV